METYRCTNPHPSRPGLCNRKLFEGRFEGEWSVEVTCERCEKLALVHGCGDMGTVLAADRVDKGAALVYV